MECKREKGGQDMTAKRVISLLLTGCFLLTLLPLSARAATEQTWEKDAEAIVTRLAEPTEEDEIYLHNRPLQGRIWELFPDPALAQVIANAFNVPTNAVLIQADLNRVLAFNAEGRGIRNLEGMQHLTSLREVNLNNNQIHDLSPLRGLQTLEHLLLDDNQIADLTPLAGLTRLQRLWLDRNRVGDIRPLQNLTNLEWITLWVNQVTDISPLRNMTRLNALWLGRNQISDIRPLGRLTNLENLMLVNNQITDLRPLYPLVRLENLWIGRQSVNLPQSLRENPFEKENVLRYPNGVWIEPETISENGTYDAPNLNWTEVTADVRTVYYTFAAEIKVGNIVEPFYGTVTQTLSRTPFQDVWYGDWFYDAVAVVFEQEIMSGWAGGMTFAPAQELSRGMVVTILHRVAGEPEPGELSPFHDVPADAWFYDAAAWASELGIIQGRGSPDVFAPQLAITRAEFATMLHRFAESQDEDMTVPEAFSLAAYTDHDQIADWAMDAMRWNVYHGLITGVNAAALAPNDHANRAMGATILMRYVQMME